MAFSRTTALEFLRRAHEQNRLAHAYLITGGPDSGKEALAAELASLVNGTAVKDIFSPKAREIFVARPELKSRRISIDQIRELEHALQMRAANSRRKIGIITDADRLGEAAANAFLKTLEEPPEHVKFILATTEPEKVLATILSRCQRYDFRNIPTREIAAHLAEICKEIQPRTWHVETEEELRPEWFAGCNLVGVSAGASTPDWVIDGVAARLGATVDEACAAALEMGVPTYRFVKRYLERGSPLRLGLKQVDPLIRQLTEYRDLIDRMTRRPE